MIVYSTWEAFIPKFGPQWKDQESIYQVSQVLALYSILVGLLLGWSYLRGLADTKLLNKSKLKGSGAS